MEAVLRYKENHDIEMNLLDDSNFLNFLVSYHSNIRLLTITPYSIESLCAEL
jgi:hypothetical protein